MRWHVEWSTSSRIRLGCAAAGGFRSLIQLAPRLTGNKLRVHIAIAAQSVPPAASSRKFARVYVYSFNYPLPLSATCPVPPFSNFSLLFATCLVTPFSNFSQFSATHRVFSPTCRFALAFAPFLSSVKVNTRPSFVAEFCVVTLPG